MNKEVRPNLLHRGAYAERIVKEPPRNLPNCQNLKPKIR